MIPRGTSTLGLLSAALILSSNTLTSPTAAAVASIWDSPSSPPTQRRIVCEDVHIFIARGGSEPYPGRQGVLVDDICAGQSSSGACGYEDILFDATIGVDYGTQMFQGATSGVLQITNYANACPDSKLVLSGYSLGAGVVGDLLAGSDAGDVVFDSTEQDVAGIVSSTTSPGNQIAAVLFFGDVRHVAGQSYNILSGADDDSYAPRPTDNLAKLNNFASVMRSYCDHDDPVCAQGNTTSVHLSYFDVYSEAAASWVRSQVGMSGTAKSTATVVADSPATSSGAAAATTASSLGSAVSSGASASSTGKALGSTSAAAAATVAYATSTGTVASASASSAAGGRSKSIGAGVAGLGGWALAWLVV